MKNLNWEKVIAVDCERCKFNDKVFSGRLKRKKDTNNFYCDGCGTTTTLNQIKQRFIKKNNFKI